MAGWKKIIVSGSHAHLASVTASGLTPSGNDELLKAGSNGELELTGITLSAGGGITGSSFTGSFTGDGSNLTGVSGEFPSTGKEGIAYDATKFFVNDGASKFISGSQAAAYIYGKASGDATATAAGAITIANDAVDNNKLANIAQGSIKVGGDSNAPTDLDASGDGKILVGDGTDINSVAVSGDVTLANNGAVTIADEAVTLAKLAHAAANTVLVRDANSAGDPSFKAVSDTQILIGDGSGFTAAALSGDVTMTNAGVVTIAADSVETSMIAHSLGEASVHSFTGSFSGSFVGDGTGLIGLATSLTVDGDSGTQDVSLADDDLQIIGTTNEIETGVTKVGTDVKVTVGLPNDVTIGNNLTVTGNLNVKGTTVTIDTANLAVEDKFILINSGSSTAGDESGIIFGGSNGSVNNGAALIWNGDFNGNDGRLAIANSVNADASSATINYHLAGVFSGTAAAAATAEADHEGNIRVDSAGDIFIYVA